MTARLMEVRGLLRVVWIDPSGEGLPVPCSRRAWRTTIYRRPVLA